MVYYLIVKVVLFMLFVSIVMACPQWRVVLILLNLHPKSFENHSILNILFEVG